MWALCYVYVGECLECRAKCLSDCDLLSNGSGKICTYAFMDGWMLYMWGFIYFQREGEREGKCSKLLIGESK